MMGEAEIAEREKIKVAFHECGHALICQIFGGIGTPEIWKNSHEAVLNGEKAWLGRFKIHVEPNPDESHYANQIIPWIKLAPNNWRVLLGLAGLVAELIVNDITDEYSIYEFVDDAIFSGEASQTDMILIGGNWQFSDVAEVTQLLISNWNEIKRKANWLALTSSDM